MYHKLVLSSNVRIRRSDKYKGYVIPRRKEKRRGEGGERFRRVIGSAGVDAILSSIPHQPPPGNLYSPGFSLSLTLTPPLLLATYSRSTRIPSSLRR